MKEETICAKALEVRKESEANGRIWWQSELRNRFANAQIRQFKGQSIVFNAVASLGKLKAHNNSAGYEYESYIWAGYTVEADGHKLETPKLLLLEVQRNKLRYELQSTNLEEKTGILELTAASGGRIESLVWRE